MPRFSKEKHKLLHTLARFDGNTTVEDVVGPNICHSDENNTFLLHCILEAFLVTRELDSHRREFLFQGVQEKLIEMGYLHPEIRLDNLMPVRRRIAARFMKLVLDIHSKIDPNPCQDRALMMENINTLFSTKLTNKYATSFKELKIIAEGGFGTVCMAEHKVDGLIYAVKKIIFKYKSDFDYLKVMREVKSISTLNHINVVSYNNAWFQPIEQTSHTESDESSTDSCASHQSGWTKRKNSKLKPPSISNTTGNNYLSSSSSDSNQSIFSKKSSFSTSHHSTQGFCEEVLKGEFSKLSIESFAPSSECTKISYNDHMIYSSKDTKTICSKRKSRHKDSAAALSLLPASEWNSKSWKIKVLLCIQMEYCDCDLRLWLDQRARGKVLPFQREVRDIFMDILHGIAHIHSKSILHRDLKPQNILYSTKDNVLKIGDFGLATLEGSIEKGIEGSFSQYSSDLGTLPYAAPEQRKRHNYDSKVDMYSLGIILIELLMHFKTEMEFCKTIEEILLGNMSNELVNQWPDYLYLVKNLVQKDPENRMSAKEILSQPLIQRNAQAERMELNQKIIYLKDALVKKDEELTEKCCLIENLEQRIAELSTIIEKYNMDTNVCYLT